MSRIRRISLRVAQQEVFLTITHTVTQTGGDHPNSGHASHDHAGREQTGGSPLGQSVETNSGPNVPEVCPACGSAWLPDFSNALQEFQINFDLLQSAMLSNRIHLLPRPDGTFRVCQRSLQEIQETPK